MAERYGSLFRRRLCSAERLSERAMRLGSFQVNTLRSRSNALLCVVTAADQRRAELRRVPRVGLRLSLTGDMNELGFKLRSIGGSQRRAPCAWNQARCLPVRWP